MTCTRLIMTAAVLALALGCTEQKTTPPIEVKVDMTLPDRGSTGGPQLFWIDIVRNEGTIMYRVRDKLVSETALRSLIKRLAAIDAKHPIVVDRLEGAGQRELNHLVTILGEAGAANISRRGKDNQAVPLK